MSVLIESDWNLKGGTRTTFTYTDLSINRIRLEFKVAYFKITTIAAFVLIESDWNLKLFRPFMPFTLFGINRIRLEFKEGFIPLHPPLLPGINRIRLEFKGTIRSKASSEEMPY